MKKRTKRKPVAPGKSERCLKAVACALSLMFAALMLYPFIFAVSCSMKDNSKIYEVPPKLLPGQANSLSVVFDYTGMEFENEEQMEDIMMQDNVLAMFSICYKMADASVMEIHVYGQTDG